MSGGDPGARVDALSGGDPRGPVDTLLALPDAQRAAHARDRGWPLDAIVRELAQRSLGLLDVDPGAALALAECADEVAASARGGLTAARAARALAHAYRVNGRFAEALERYDAARAGFVAAGEADEAARTLIGTVDALMYLGRYNDARETAQAARAELAALGDERRVARLDVNLGNVYHRLDRPAEALAAYDRAYEALRTHGDALDLAAVDDNRANVLAALNRFDDALAAYFCAQDAYRKHGQAADYAWSAYNEAYLHFLRGRYGQALAGLARVRDLFAEQHNQHGQALCDLDEAEVALVLNRLDEAAELSERAARAFDGLGLRYEAAKSRAFGAVAALDRADYSVAGRLLAEARALFEQEGNMFWAATVQLIAADLHLRHGDAGGAAARCDSALAVLDQGGYAGRAARGRVLRGRALHLLGAREEALRDARAACDAATESGDRVVSHQAFHLLGRLQDEAGDADAAAASYARATDDVDALRGSMTRDDLRISFVRDKVALYEDAVRNFLKRDRIADAFAQVERAKARALIDLLAAGPGLRVHGEDEDARLAARVEQLRGELAGLYNRLHGTGEGHQRFAEGQGALLERLRQHEREISAALGALRSRQEQYVSLRSVTTAGLAEVRGRLGAAEALVEYFLLGDDVIAFVVTADEARVYGPLATRGEVEDLLKRWRFNLAQFNFPSSFVQRQGGRLYDTALDTLETLYWLLVKPLAPSLHERALVIVPHGPLHNVPFHALHDGRAHLIERHDVSYAPSATMLTMHHLTTPSSGPSLIVGVHNPALPYIADEVRTVAACRPAPLVLMGDDATRARFSAEAARASSIHLATHAVFRADNPLFSAVQLADDWLTVTDVYNLRLAADLVVLSACETGASEVLHGDELIGLTRGFLYAGARALVVSLWAANDAATAGLMAGLYRAIADGSGVRPALRAAQRAAMERHPHPYYWAPFIALGRVTTGQ